MSCTVFLFLEIRLQNVGFPGRNGFASLPSILDDIKTLARKKKKDLGSGNHFKHIQGERW